MIHFSRHHHSRCNVHRHEFLEKQFGCVGKFDLGNLGLVLTALALKDVLPEIGDGYQAAQVADMDSVRIRHFEQPLS